jgi:UDP-4-amino-4,6-dideoxy-N-acetyl-beta-L-altrosamine transaminase
MIPYGKQEITDDDIESVLSVLKSDFLTQGPVVPEFEGLLCGYTGAKYSVLTSNATSALHIACLALGLSRNDTLWTSPITFIASASCALFCGASVDFVDINPGTGLMSIKKLKEKLEVADKSGKLPKIVIPVHLAGQSCDMESIYKLSKKYGFKIIEDAAHAIGAKYKQEAVGSCHYSDITIFSFHPVKIITTGEGGAALTNNIELAHHMNLLRSHGITRNKDEMRNPSEKPWYYEQISLGYNYRMTDIQAALGISQFSRLDKYIKKRTNIAKHYTDELDLNKVTPLEQKNDRSSSWHLYIIKVIDKSKRDGLVKVLQEHGIGTNLHYIPLYRHPYIQCNYNLSGSEQYYNSAITIPLFPNISYGDVSYIANTINSNL